VSDNGTVTPDGDIVIHNKGTFTYTASFQNEDGSDRNMTGRNLYFVTNSGIRVQLLPGVNAWEKKLVIPQETLKVALRMTSEFAIVDEKPMPSMLWNGRAVSRSGVVMAGTVIISGSPSGSVVIKGGHKAAGRVGRAFRPTNSLCSRALKEPKKPGSPHSGGARHGRPGR
jgi:hypothetical protein